MEIGWLFCAKASFYSKSPLLPEASLPSCLQGCTTERSSEALILASSSLISKTKMGVVTHIVLSKPRVIDDRTNELDELVVLRIQNLRQNLLDSLIKTRTPGIQTSTHSDSTGVQLGFGILKNPPCSDSNAWNPYSITILSFIRFTNSYWALNMCQALCWAIRMQQLSKSQETLLWRSIQYTWVVGKRINITDKLHVRR